jgi:hypothetical protein
MVDPREIHRSPLARHRALVRFPAGLQAAHPQPPAGWIELDFLFETDAA